MSSLPAYFLKYLFQILKMYFSFVSHHSFAPCSPLVSRDNSGIDLFSRLMARIENVVDELQAYLLRIKHTLDPCVEHIAQINTWLELKMW